MTTFVEGAIEDIDERLRQLRDELARLEGARAALEGGRRPSRTRGPRTAAPRAATSRPPRRRSRSAGNTRADQSLDLIRSQPGIKARNR